MYTPLLRVHDYCLVELLRVCCMYVFTPQKFLLRHCYCQPYLSALSLPLTMAVNTQSVWHHPLLMSGQKSEDHKVLTRNQSRDLHFFVSFV